CRGCTAMAKPNLYAVHLSPQQRQRLEDLSRNGHAPAKKIAHARVLLLADKDHDKGRYEDRHIATVLDLHINSVARIRKLFVQHGETPALERKARLTPPTPAKLDGRAEAHLIATCCSPPPEGQARWTLTLLVEDLTTRGFVTTVSRETVRRTMDRNELKPWRK